MHATDLIAAALSRSDPDYPADTASAPGAPGVCCLTGVAGADTLPRRDIIPSGWTEGALFRAPGSDRIGRAAAIALRYRPERASSWLVTERELRRLDRVGVRAAVLGPAPDTCWSGYATTSYKKHGALRAPVNPPGPGLWLWESRVVDCRDTGQVADWWARILEARVAGLPRPCIEYLDPAPKTMRAFGVRRWIEFEAWARPRIDSALYRFLSYLLPSEEEIRHADR